MIGHECIILFIDQSERGATHVLFCFFKRFRRDKYYQGRIVKSVDREFLNGKIILSDQSLQSFRL